MPKKNKSNFEATKLFLRYWLTPTSNFMSLDGSVEILQEKFYASKLLGHPVKLLPYETATREESCSLVLQWTIWLLMNTEYIESNSQTSYYMYKKYL